MRVASLGHCRTQFLPGSVLITLRLLSSASLPLSSPNDKRKFFNMVVVHAQPSTSAPVQKKNRRKLHKKRIAGEDTDMHEDAAPTTPGAQGSNDTVEDDDLMIDSEDAIVGGDNGAPAFAPLPASAQRTTLKSETRRVPIPPHRMTPLKKEWVNIFGPLTEILGLQVRMNVQRRCVEIRVSPAQFYVKLARSISHRHPNTQKKLAHFRKGQTL